MAIRFVVDDAEIEAHQINERYIDIRFDQDVLNISNPKARELWESLGAVLQSAEVL